MSPISDDLANKQSRASDHYGREIRGLRMSVTQKCDLSCPHCHREGQTPSSVEMSPEEIERLVRVGSSLGISKVKITGGEPLLREDIVDIVARISPIVSEVSITTNGSRLAGVARDLRAAGLKRVNVSLHSIDPERFERLCGRNEISAVVRGIESAVGCGMNPVKVNMVVFKNENESEISPMMEFCGKVGAVLQLIEFESSKEDMNGNEFAMKYFSLSGVAKPGSTPEVVEQGICKEIEKLQKEKVSEHELQKVKNQFAADNYRRLESRFFLMLQVLIADSNRGWQSLNEDPKRIAAVTADDVQRVANRYFKPENRAVALYYTKKAEGGEEDPLLTGLSDQEKVQVRQFRQAVSQMSLDEARAIIRKLEPQMGEAPPEKKKLMEALHTILQDKIQNGGK